MELCSPTECSRSTNLLQIHHLAYLPKSSRSLRVSSVTKTAQFLVDKYRIDHRILGTKPHIHPFFSTHAQVLDGQQWFTTADGDWALAVIGRSISTPGRHRVGFSGAALRSLPVRRTEMAAYAALLDNGSGGDRGGVVGNRHYWDSDTMVHRRRDYVAVVRMRSKRTVAARCINGACLDAQHVADGSLQLYPTDSPARYLDMPAVWDWHALPGVTTPTDAPFLPCDPKVSESIGYNWPLLMGGASFVGGASDGEFGATAMQFGPTGLLGTTGFILSRSHFAFDNAVVVLGTGLQAVGKPLHIATTIINERLNGLVWMDSGKTHGVPTVLPPVRLTL